VAGSLTKFQKSLTMKKVLKFLLLPAVIFASCDANTSEMNEKQQEPFDVQSPTQGAPDTTRDSLKDSANANTSDAYRRDTARE
jgi:hypothetical protein